MYPDVVERFAILISGKFRHADNSLRYAVICGSARTSPHNQWYGIPIDNSLLAL